MKKKKTKKIVIIILIIIFLPSIFLIGLIGAVTVVFGGHEQNEQSNLESYQILDFEVEAYRISVSNEVSSQGLDPLYVDYLLSIMQVSTGGIGLDPMRASGFDSNTQGIEIADPAYSIACAVTEFKYLLEYLDVQLDDEGKPEHEKIRLLLQTYHLGRDYLEYSDFAHTSQKADDYIEENSILDGNMYFADDVKYWIDRFSTKGDGSLIHPLPNNRYITQAYGVANDRYASGYHNGVDFGAPEGTPILAVADGLVVLASYTGDWGNYVKIKHNASYTTAYAHLVRYGEFKVGDMIEQGDVLGYVGNTGASAGAHLHFEIFVNGYRRDPMEYVETDFRLGVGIGGEIQ